MHSNVLEWASPNGQQALRRERGEERRSRLSPFHLQPDSYFLKLSTR